MQKILDFLSNMSTVMQTTLNFILNGKKVRLNIGPGGSYTDGKSIKLGVPKEFEGLSLEIIYMMSLALTGHEAQHVLSSNFKEFKRYNEEEVLNLVNKGVSHRFASHYVHSVGNIIEDGRIENILVNRLPGFIPKIQYLNMFFWNLGELNEDVSSFDAYIQTMLSLSVLGIYPKEYNKLNNKEVETEINKIKSLIKDGVKARTCKDGLDICREILAISEPFVLEEYEKIKKNEEIMDSIVEMLSELMEEHGNSEETELNDSGRHSSHISIDNKSKEKENEEGNENQKNNSKEEQGEEKEGTSDKSNSANEDEEDSEDKTGEDESSSGSEEDENSDSKENSDKGKGKAGEENTGDEEDTEDTEEESENSKDNDKKNSSKEEKNEDEKSNDIEDGKNTEIKDGKDKKDKENENNQDEEIEAISLSDGLSSCENNAERDINDDINERMKELSEQLEVEARKDIKKAESQKKDREKEKSNNKKLSQEDINKTLLKDVPTDNFEEQNEDFPLNHKIPRNVEVISRNFKDRVRHMFDSKALGSVSCQKKGILDNENLYRTRLGDRNIFKSESVVNDTEHVVYILRDGSGSMYGEKDMTSMTALAIIEEGIKNVIPFKSVTFSTDANKVVHRVIKGWDDNSEENYAYNYIQHYKAFGGNIDSVSIRIAAKELLNRPEKDKTLIVLSDGLPYSKVATKKAIEDTREKGINLIGIMFGNKEFRESHLEFYIDMYQTNVISTSVERIPDRLISVLEEILQR